MQSEEIFKLTSIAILGLGLIGGSIAKALKNTAPEIQIFGFDKDEISGKAFDLGIIDFTLQKIEDAIKSEIIFLCLPAEFSIQAFQKLIPLISDDQIITDVCGVKGIFEKVWQREKQKGNYFGGHPMTGKEKGGFENSDSLLFENSIYIINNSAKNNPAAKNLIPIIQKLGANIEFLSPEIHDKIVANVSHLPQISAVALVNSINKVKNEIDPLNYSGGGFKDMTRIASSDFNIWKDILHYNKNEIISTLSNFITELQIMKDSLSVNKFEEIKKSFDNANLQRTKIKESRKGFLNPLFEIFIFVKDEPGMISKISTALFQNEINIKDFELLKIREGKGGTFRLSFEKPEDAAKALRILREMGFKNN